MIGCAMDHPHLLWLCSCCRTNTDSSSTASNNQEPDRIAMSIASATAAAQMDSLMPCDTSAGDSGKRKAISTQTNSIKKQRSAEQPYSNGADVYSIHAHDSVNAPVPVVEQTELVSHWVKNSCDWSQFLKKTTTMDDAPSVRSQKRSLSRSSSYRQSTISGLFPRAWGAGHAANLLAAGVFMQSKEGATITEADEQLIQNILAAQHELPQDWRFQNENFLKILNLACYKNEQRIIRDIGPHAMPSPELLHAQGISLPGFEHIREELDTQWTKCTLLCGPKPRPDVTHGVSRSAFASDELEKLIMNNTAGCDTSVFPFYIGEVKCFERSIEIAELQALRSASIACNTVIELYRKVSAAEELHRRVLAFSVSYNHRSVKIFGHFPLIDGENITFHRRQIFQTDFFDDKTSWTRPYQITLGIWKFFFPLHLARIRDALARQPSVAIGSFPIQLTQSGRSSPSILPDENQRIISLQEENSNLVNNLLEQQQELRRERTSLDHHLRQMERQLEEHQQQMERRSKEHQQQMERQSEQYKERLERQSEQYKERLERQSEQHEERLEQQKEQHEGRLEQQKEQHEERLEQQKEQLEQLKEIIALLKQSRS